VQAELRVREPEMQEALADLIVYGQCRLPII
jgi:hypothetical protein